MATEYVLLTGATGNVGAVTLEQLLETPHTVNAIVRNSAKATPFFTSKYPDAISSGKLAITSIPDMTVPGAFDEAAASATAIIHVATPLGTSNFEDTMIKPTWAIDHNVLEAAKKSKAVKRLKIDESRFNNLRIEESRDEWGPAYQFSKTNAEKKTWEWMEVNMGKIGFDVVMLLPPSITGRSPQPDYKPSPEHPGGIGGILRVLFTKSGANGVDRAFPFFLDTDDVAKCHVLSLDREKVKGNERYLIVSDEALDLRSIVIKLRHDIPELTGRVPAFEERSEALKLATLDLVKGSSVFGNEWKKAYDSVRAVVEDVLAWERENGTIKAEL